MGSKPRHQIFMDSVLHFYNMYPDVPKFSFLFHSEYSHETMTSVKNADEDTVDMLSVCTFTMFFVIQCSFLLLNRLLKLILRGVCNLKYLRPNLDAHVPVFVQEYEVKTIITTKNRPTPLHPTNTHPSHPGDKVMHSYMIFYGLSHIVYPFRRQ